MSLIDLNDEIDTCIHLANAIHMMAAYLPKQQGSSVSEVAYVIDQKLCAVSERMGAMIAEAKQ